LGISHRRQSLPITPRAIAVILPLNYTTSAIS